MIYKYRILCVHKCSQMFQNVTLFFVTRPLLRGHLEQMSHLSHWIPPYHNIKSHVTANISVVNKQVSCWPTINARAFAAKHSQGSVRRLMSPILVAVAHPQLFRKHLQQNGTLSPYPSACSFHHST